MINKIFIYFINLIVYRLNKKNLYYFIIYIFKKKFKFSCENQN